MSQSITIRPLTADDHSELLSLWYAAGLPCKPGGRDSEAAFVTQLALPQIHYLGAFDGETMVGSALATHDGRKGWINRVAVHPTHQRKGLGSELIRACEAWLAECGIGIFACLIEGWNDSSRALVRAIGYEEFEGVSYFTKRTRSDI